MAVQCPPPPILSPIVDKNGVITFAWSQFFTQLFQRIGQGSALSNIELASGSTDQLATITAEIEALNVGVESVNALALINSANINTLDSQVDGLQQGRLP